MNCPNCGHELNPDTLQINLAEHDLRVVCYGPDHWRVQYADRELDEWCDTGPPHRTRKAAIAYGLGQIINGNFPKVV